jgi:CheY-like chemotaxis protein
VIDDHRHVREMVTLCLRAADLDAVAADGGPAALQVFDASHFDLVVVDIFMMGMDGLTLIRALRGRRPTLPVIAISGVPLDFSGSSALDLLPNMTGLSDIICLSKPFKRDQLLRAVRTAIGVTQPP